jgi:AraC-like DNA-binding protein
MTGRFAPGLAEREVGALPMAAAYFHLILRRYGRSRDGIARLLAGTGFEPGDVGAGVPREEIALWQGIQQVRNLARMAPPGWGLELGSALDTASHGTLGVAASSAATLREALETLERFAYLRAPYFRLEGETQSSSYRLRVAQQIPLEPDVWVGMVELLLLSLQALVESALGRPMEAASFEIDFDAPPYAGRYASALHAPVRFGRPVTALELPSEWLPLPCPFADPALHGAATLRLEAAERGLSGPRFIGAQVERILEGARDELPTLGEVAARLRISRRTLVRRLAERGTTFRALVDEARKQRAAALLADPEVAVSEVAYGLGYTDPANFGRAFRRWFGESPRRYREGIGRAIRH